MLFRSLNSMTNPFWKDLHVVEIEPIDVQWCGIVLADGEGSVWSAICEADNLPFDGELIQVPYYYVGSNLLNFYSCGLYNPNDETNYFSQLSQN